MSKTIKFDNMNAKIAVIDASECWGQFKKWVNYYRDEHQAMDTTLRDRPGRYCIAISCEELLNKMEEIEKENIRYI